MKATASRYTIILIELGKTMADQSAKLVDFSRIIMDSKVDNFVEKLEQKHNMRCCLLVKES